MDLWSRSVTVPILQSLLLADHVYRDQMTGKHIICGVFSTIYFTPNPPIRPPSNEPHPMPDSPGNGNSSRGGMPGGGQEIAGGLPVSPGWQSPGNPPLSGGHGETHPAQSRQQPIQQLMQAGSPYVYFSVTELLGRKLFEVRYVDLKENRTLFQTELPIECHDPLLTVEVTLPLPRLPLVDFEERSYGLEVVCEGQLLGTYRVLARITPGSAPASNN